MDTPVAALKALKHFSHAAETAMAQRDVIQVELDNLRSLIRTRKKSDRRKLRVEALLIDNIEAINAVEAQEQQSLRGRGPQGGGPQRGGRQQRGKQRGQQSQRRLGGGLKRKRGPERSSSEEDEGQDKEEEEKAGEEEEEEEDALEVNNDSDTSSVRSVIIVRRA